MLCRWPNQTGTISASPMPMRASPLRESSPVVDDTYSEMSISIDAPDDDEFPSAEIDIPATMQSIYQAAYNISRSSLHPYVPAATNMDRTNGFSHDSTETQDYSILEEPEFQADDPFADGCVRSADESEPGPSESRVRGGSPEWRAHIEDSVSPLSSLHRYAHADRI